MEELFWHTGFNTQARTLGEGVDMLLEWLLEVRRE